MRAHLQSLAVVLLCAGPALSQTPTPARNVNMVSGTKWPGGDPFLQRQNEPSIAVSSRNPLHVVGGANDYRTVDLPLTDALPNAGLAGDAWLGLFKSFNGGQTWQSTLIPGYPQDRTPEGMASPLKGFSTASDPVVRPGTNGLFYYAGIAFDRATGRGAVFVARFIDLNNRENGNAAPASASETNTDSIRYVGTSIAARSATGEFIDKPWIAVDVPRAGAGVCSFQVAQPQGSVSQSFAAGNVYLLYTKFLLDPSGNTVGSQLLASRSTDCGRSWSLPLPLVPIDDLAVPSRSIHQGAVVQVDPQSGLVYVAWRRFHDSRKPDSLFIAASIDRGRSFTPGIPVVSYPAPADPLHPAVPSFFDQGTTATSFRTNAFPTLAIDDSGVPGWPGRVYLAWSQRMPPYGDARIMLLDFPGSLTLSSTGLALVPSVADNGALVDDVGSAFWRGNQLMPQLSFVGGKLLAVYYDQRLDHTVGNYSPATPLAPDALGRFFLENRVFAGELPLSPGLVFGNFITDANPPLSQRRHTVDVVAAEANGGLHPAFTIARVSQYRIGTRPGSRVIEQLQVNPPDLPLFKGGTAANIGDYIDVAGQTFVPNGSGWVFNTAPSRAPVRIAAWTSNQDVRPPLDGNWQNYTPVGLEAGRASVLDGTAVPDCRVGQTGMRNQNIYSSRITEGLAAFSPQNSKPLSLTVQRAFVVDVQNFTSSAKTFRLRIDRQPEGGAASFVQARGVPPTTTLDVTIGARAGVARTVFAVSSNATASIPVDIVEVTTPGGSVVPAGLSATVVLNPDGTAPPLTNPDGAPAGTDVATAEIYNPDLANPDLANPDLANPDLANPDLANPDLANPDLANPDLANPNVPNPDLANVGVVNPDLANPDLANPDLANFNLSDASYTLTNAGNTTASYRIRLVGTSPGDAKLQLILSKRYLTPVAYNCALAQEAQNTVEANVSQPPIVDPSDPDLANPDLANPDLANATLSLAPGESARVTIRGNVDLARMRQIVSGIAPVAVAQSANTGTTTPQISAPLFITTAQLGDGVVGTPYLGAVQAIGGSPGYVFSADGLPQGLSIDGGGVISGTPQVATAFPPSAGSAGSAGLLVAFVVRDAANQLATRTINVRIANPLAIDLRALPTAVQGTAYSFALPAIGGIAPYAWSAKTLPPWLSLTQDGTLRGTPPSTGAPFVANVELQVSDAASPAQAAAQSFALSVVPPVVLNFVQQPGTLAPGGLFSPSVAVQARDANAAPVAGIAVLLTLGANPAGGTLSGGGTVLTNSDGVASFPSLSIDRAGGAYTLIASAAGASPIASSPFDVAAICGGVMVDLQTDVDNCGACGVACAAAQRCTAGTCVADQVPTITPLGAVTVYEGRTATVAVSGAQGQGAPLTFSLVNAPEWAAIAPTGPESAEIALSPDASSRQLANPIAVEVLADDGFGGFTQATLAVTVTHPPVIGFDEMSGIPDTGGDITYPVRGGSMRQVLVQATTAQATATTPLSVACDPGVSVSLIQQTGAPGPSVFSPPAFAGLALIEYAPRAADAGTVKRCQMASSDGTTNVTRAVTFTVGNGLLASAPVLAGAMPAITSPAIFDGVPGRRFLLVSEHVGMGVYEVTGDAVGPRAAFVETPQENQVVATMGHYAFVAGGAWGWEPMLWVYDVADPLHPSFIGEWTDPAGFGPMTDIAVDEGGGRIAVASQNQTYVFSVGTFLATGNFGDLTWTPIATPDAPNGSGNAAGRAAFAALGGRDVLLVPEEYGMALYAFDLNETALLGTYFITHNAHGYGAHSVTVLPNAAGGRTLAVLNMGNVLGDGWIEVLDVTDPARMAMLVPPSTKNPSGSAVNVSGNGDSFDGLHWFGVSDALLRTVDFSDPAAPALLGENYVGAFAGGTALAPDRTRLYESLWEQGAAIWSPTQLTAPPYQPAPLASGARAEMRFVTAVDGTIGLSAVRDRVSKLDTSRFPATATGTAIVTGQNTIQGIMSARVRGTFGVTGEGIWGGSADPRQIGVRLRTWDLAGTSPVELGRTEITGLMPTTLDFRHLDMVPGLPCVLVGVNGWSGTGAGALGGAVLMIDTSDSSNPALVAALHPAFGGATLPDAPVWYAGSDGRFLVASAPLPDGTGSAFFWDLGSPPRCAAPAFLGNVPPADTLFNSRGGGVVDAARHIFYSMSAGGSVRLVDFSALAAAAAANQPLDVVTQTRVAQINFRLPVGFGGHSLLLSDSALVVATDVGPRVFSRNADGTLVLQENVQANSPNTFEDVWNPIGGLGFADEPYLYWDRSDPNNPNAFVEQGLVFARKWASCPAANNLDCSASTHP